jgi:hypothetical protein
MNMGGDTLSTWAILLSPAAVMATAFWLAVISPHLRAIRARRAREAAQRQAAAWQRSAALPDPRMSGPAMRNPGAQRQHQE